MLRRNLFAPAAAMLLTVLGACAPKALPGLVLVKGGAFTNTKSAYYAAGKTLPSFYIGQHEVTQHEWLAVMSENPAQAKGDDLPVEMVSWYDCLMYCNKRSAQEGLTACYTIQKDQRDPANTNEQDDLKWLVTLNAQANGYRLPTEAEWEYAAGGGQASKSYAYSGGNNIGEVAWYWKNAGDKPLADPWSWPLLVANKNRPRPVGSKAPNELGIYDMSGNVREWCWDWRERRGPDDNPGRIWKGGGWIGADFCCEPTFRADLAANGAGPDQGLRVCRNE